MAKKSSLPTPDTTITITLPGQGGIVRTGTIIAKRGDLAHMRQFEYSSQADIAEALAVAIENLVAVEISPPPVIKTTDADVYKPDLEAKRKTLAVGSPVRTGDSAESGTIVEFHEDQFVVDVGKPVHGCYPIDSLTIIPPAPAALPGPDPLSVKGQVSEKAKTARPATDATPTDKAQLSLF